MLIGYRTLIVASLITVLGVVQGLDWVSLLPDNKAASGWVVSGIGIVMMILRTMSNTTVTKTTSPAPMPPK